MTREKTWKKKQKNKMEVRQKVKGRDVQGIKTILMKINSNAGPAQYKTIDGGLPARWLEDPPDKA